MLVLIRHRTEYVYQEPVWAGVQYLRVTPATDNAQIVRDWRVDAPGKLHPWTDSFGNACNTLVMDRPASVVTIHVEGEVETIGGDGIVPPASAEPPAAVFLRHTSYTEPAPIVRDFANRYRSAFEGSLPGGLNQLMHDVIEAMPYREGTTHVHTTAAEALADGYGVCQDHAHVFITCCRLLGVPARYVGGYLVTGKEGIVEEHGAGHAWAEALVPGQGWLSFDVSNRTAASERHVRVAVALDYSGAGPVRGVRSGGGEEDMRVSIRIESRGTGSGQIQQ